MALDELKNFDKEAQEMFKSCCNKLLFNSFLCRDKKDNYKYYLFICTYKRYFDEFFAILGDELLLNQDLGTVHLKNNYSVGTYKLTKEETIIVFTLRILYQERLINTSLKNTVEITVDDLYKKLQTFNFKRKIFKTGLEQVLKTFRKYNILDNMGDLKFMTTHILIYPTITQLIPVENIMECYKTITELESGKGEQENENFDENKID